MIQYSSSYHQEESLVFGNKKHSSVGQLSSKEYSGGDRSSEKNAEDSQVKQRPAIASTEEGRGTTAGANSNSHQWLLRQVRIVKGLRRSDGFLLKPVIQRFKEYIINDGRVRMLFTAMWDEADWYGERIIEDYDHMLEVLNYIISRAPEWSDIDVGTGILGSPMYGLFEFGMKTARYVLSLSIQTNLFSGRMVFLDRGVNELLCDVLKEWSTYLESPESTNVLDTHTEGWFSPTAMRTMMEQTNIGTNYTFEEMFLCDSGFKSWDAFFTREFRPGRRPVASSENQDVIVNACESRPYRISTDCNLRDRFWIKQQPYSIIDMLACDPLAVEFKGATVYQAFLSALSYHRWHAPVSGKIVRSFVQPGTYFSEPPFQSIGEHPGLGQVQSYLTSMATRGIILIQADNPRIGLMAFIAVGMDDVSSCEITVAEGQAVQKGDQLGLFHYGGSSHCLLFRKDVKLQGFPALGGKQNLPVCGKLAHVTS